MPVARNAAELPGVPLVRAADTEGTRDILSFFKISWEKLTNIFFSLLKIDIFDIFFLKYDEGNLLIIIIPGGSFLFITLVSRGTEILRIREYLSSHDVVTI